MDDLAIVKEAQKRFARVAEFHTKDEQIRIRHAIFCAGTQWGVAATPDQIINTLDAAGFKIVAKK